MFRSPSRAARVIAVVGAVFLVAGFLVGRRVDGPGVRIMLSMAVAARDDYRPSYSVESGSEIVLVYLGARGCVGSNTRQFLETLRRLKFDLAAKVGSLGTTFRAVGIATDWKVEDGFLHLAGAGRFDEVVVGNGWMNAGALRYVWEQIESLAATPQILVLRRSVLLEEGSVRPRIENVTVLVRKSGAAAITNWYRSGLPLPSRGTGS